MSINTAKHIRGLGRELPPVKKHVLVYFQQKGLSIQAATEFYQHYHKRNWLNLNGNLIKDWKMCAWQWIWNKL
jgi:hypothetical protein